MKKKDVIPISSCSLERTIAFTVFAILLVALIYYGWTELTHKPVINASTPEADLLNITPAPTLSSASANFIHPNIYLNKEEIDAVKEKVRLKQKPWKTAYDKMISDANAALMEQIPSVTYGGETLP